MVGVMSTTTTPQPLKNISDTARMVALLRAMESERPDAHFHDPLARELADDKSNALLNMLQTSRRFDERIMAVRTQVLDDLILEEVGNGVDCVVNLASGLDTRPFRLNLPADLLWVEVDLPDILTYKESKLTKVSPKCRWEVVKLDLRERDKRRALFRRINEQSKRVLVLSEGILMYLQAEEVARLAQDLAEQSQFSLWLADLLSPRELKVIHRKWGKEFKAANAFPPFAPEEGAEFFSPYGWSSVQEKSFIAEAYRLNRENGFARMVRWFSPILPGSIRRELTRRYGCVLLNRAKSSLSC